MDISKIFSLAVFSTNHIQVFHMDLPYIWKTFNYFCDAYSVFLAHTKELSLWKEVNETDPASIIFQGTQVVKLFSTGMLNLSEDHALKPRAFVFAVMQKESESPTVQQNHFANLLEPCGI